MRRSYYRRRASSSGRFYDIMDNKLPIKLSFATIAITITILFIMFVMALLAAVIFGSANSKLDTAEINAAKCSNYYAAETTAADILTILSADDGNSLTDKNGELKYDTGKSEITISRNGGNFSFDVPITDPAIKNNSSSRQEKNLHVIARITGGKINIIQWYIQD